MIEPMDDIESGRYQMDAKKWVLPRASSGTFITWGTRYTKPDPFADLKK